MDALEITGMAARELVRAMRERELSCREVMAAFLERMDAVNPQVNAIIDALEPERALALAGEADARHGDGVEHAPLYGLPWAVKDLLDVRGFRKTYGSPVFADHRPQADAPVVRRLRAAGALIVAKTNTPELGLGSHTFNPVHGVTRNPWDAARSAGGSSGGAAAALAARMLPLADGSDMGGSLRDPAAFCGVVGLRPSIGRVPGDAELGWLARLATVGPMGRDVADVARLLSVMAGAERNDPLALDDDPGAFAAELAMPRTPLRVAWSEDLGLYPVAREVARVCRAACATLAELGAAVEAAEPDLGGAMDVFKTHRAAALHPRARDLEAAHPGWREAVKATAVWNLEQALALDGQTLLTAERERTRLYRNAVAFFERYDFLVLPTTQVAPFPVEQEWVREIEGVSLPTYLDWMASCCVISVTGLPSISVPCGFTAAGLPVGLQIVGPPRGELALLRFARAYELARPAAIGARRPPVPTQPAEEDGS